MKTITDRIDAVSKLTGERLIDTPPPPRSVKIELVGNCNFSCWFCGTGTSQREKRHMDFELFKKITSEAKDIGIAEVGLFYLGESTLYPQLVEAVSFAKGIGIEYVFLTTNGYSLSEELLFDLFDAGLDSLKFSFNYKDRESCLETTGVDAYEQIISNIELANKIRNADYFNCRLYASSIEYNEDARSEMEESISRISPFLEEHYWLPLFNQGGHLADHDDMENTTGNNVARSDDDRNTKVCWGLFSKTNVTWDGILSACCFDHKGEFSMGDLKSETFMESWHSEKFKELRSKHINDDIEDLPCHKCLHK